MSTPQPESNQNSLRDWILVLILINMFSLLLGIWTIHGYLKDIRGVLYDFRTQIDYREVK